MPFPFEMDRMLVGAPRHTPLRVVHILFDSNRRSCAERGIGEGDELTCVDSLGDDVVVETATHERRRLDRAIALCIEVERLPLAAPLVDAPPVAAPPVKRPEWRLPDPPSMRALGDMRRAASPPS